MRSVKIISPVYDDAKTHRVKKLGAALQKSICDSVGWSVSPHWPRTDSAPFPLQPDQIIYYTRSSRNNMHRTREKVNYAGDSIISGRAILEPNPRRRYLANPMRPGCEIPHRRTRGENLEKTQTAFHTAAVKICSFLSTLMSRLVPKRLGRQPSASPRFIADQHRAMWEYPAVQYSWAGADLSSSRAADTFLICKDIYQCFGFN